MVVEKGPAVVAQSEPKDAYRVAYIIHFLLGAGNLLPWNAFITAIDYFGSLYPTKHIEKVFAVAYMSSSVLVLVMIMSHGSWCSSRMSCRLRMNLGFSLFVLSMMVAPTLDWSSSSSSMRPAGAYSVTVASVVTCGCADGLIAGTLIGSAGKLPKQYMQAVFAGTASSGVLVSILRIITKALLPQTAQGLQTSAHFYFIVSTIILLCCIFLSNLLYKLPVVEYHCKQVAYGDDLFHVRPKFRAVARKIRWPGFGVLTIYVVTLSIFPGFLAEDLKSNMLRDWYPVLGLRCEAIVLSTLCSLPPWTNMAENGSSSSGSNLHARRNKRVFDKCSYDPRTEISSRFRGRVGRNWDGCIPGDWLSLWICSWLVLDHMKLQCSAPEQSIKTFLFSCDYDFIEGACQQTVFTY